MRPTKVPMYSEVTVIWKDSTVTPGWRHPRMDGRLLLVGPLPNKTRGFCAGVTDDAIFVSSTIGREGAVLYPIAIPWGCIIKKGLKVK